MLFVDYLEKVPVMLTGVGLTHEKQIRIVTEGSKNLAMAHCMPIMALAASDLRFERSAGALSRLVGRFKHSI